MSAPDELHSLTLSIGKALRKFTSKGDDKELVELLPVLFSLPCEFAKSDNSTQRWVMSSQARGDITDDYELNHTTALDRVLDVGGLSDSIGKTLSDSQLADVYKANLSKGKNKEELTTNLIGICATCANKLVNDPVVLQSLVHLQNEYGRKNPLDSVAKLVEFATCKAPRFILTLAIDLFDAKLVPKEAFSLRSLQGKADGQAGKSFCDKLTFKQELLDNFMNAILDDLDIPSKAKKELRQISMTVDGWRRRSGWKRNNCNQKSQVDYKWKSHAEFTQSAELTWQLMDKVLFDTVHDGKVQVWLTNRKQVQECWKASPLVEMVRNIEDAIDEEKDRAKEKKEDANKDDEGKKKRVTGQKIAFQTSQLHKCPLGLN